jgi:hypothetical protein
VVGGSRDRRDVWTWHGIFLQDFFYIVHTHHSLTAIILGFIVHGFMFNDVIRSSC